VWSPKTDGGDSGESPNSETENTGDTPGGESTTVYEPIIKSVFKKLSVKEQQAWMANFRKLGSPQPFYKSVGE
jgi:hypothetical protein